MKIGKPEARTTVQHVTQLEQETTEKDRLRQWDENLETILDVKDYVLDPSDENSPCLHDEEVDEHEMIEENAPEMDDFTPKVMIRSWEQRFCCPKVTTRYVAA